MRKNMKFMAVVMAATMLFSGCNNNSDVAKQNAAETTSKSETEVAVVENAEAEEEGQADFIEQLRVKYAANETNTYTDPMYNLPADHKFVYENISEDYEWDYYTDIEVFSDSELTSRVDITFEMDYDNHKLVMSPNLVFNLNGEGSTTDDDGTWGSRSKFYLVQHRDLTTNELLEKPQVTVFTIARELQSPTIKQSVSNEGYYQLQWDAVEGADSYSVYCFKSETEYAELELTTTETVCNSSEFESVWEHDEETMGRQISMNQNLMLTGNEYFVVAMKNGEICSGMSNICDITEIAGSIPKREGFDQEVSFEGTSAMILPTHTVVEMIDDTQVQMLLDYKDIEIVQMGDTTFQLNVRFLNFPITPSPLYFHGMDSESFMADLENVIAREESLITKSVTQESNIDIPFVPEQKPTEENVPDETEDVKETAVAPETEADMEQLMYANSALGEWIAVQMLNHEETISLDGFPEASDSEYLCEVLLEAYRQNPLIDVMEDLSYDYDTNELHISYANDAETSKEYQTASIQKAKEITAEIITDDMTDFEKEDAINQYLCANGSYNDKILEYINEDGTIADEALTDSITSFLPYGILVENVGVCESYSEAFWMIGKMAGLEVIIETGSLDGVNHEWNRVKIDDSWCILDVTNNDNEYLPNSYFNLSEEMSADILIPDYTAVTADFFANYQAADDEKEYYYQKGKYALDTTQAVELLSGSLAESGNAAIRVASDITEADVDTIMGEVVSRVGLTSGNYYYNQGVLSVITE